MSASSPDAEVEARASGVDESAGAPDRPPDSGADSASPEDIPRGDVDQASPRPPSAREDARPRRWPGEPTASVPHPGAESGARPVSEALRRRAVHLTAPRSDALGRCLLSRRLVELFSLRNGTLVATFQGAGYLAWRVFITADGRILENADASEPDPLGDAAGQFAIVREPGRLHLANLGPRPPGHDLARSPHPPAEQADEDGRQAQQDGQHV